MPRKRRNRGLELLVLVLRAADEAHRGHAVAIAVERRLGGVAQVGIVGEAEIVVGAEIQHLAAADLDLGRLRRGDHALGFVEPGRFQPFEFGGEMGKEALLMENVDPLEDRGVVAASGCQVYRKIDRAARGRSPTAQATSPPRWASGRAEWSVLRRTPVQRRVQLARRLLESAAFSDYVRMLSVPSARSDVVVKLHSGGCHAKLAD